MKPELAALHRKLFDSTVAVVYDGLLDESLEVGEVVAVAIAVAFHVAKSCGAVPLANGMFADLAARHSSEN